MQQAGEMSMLCNDEGTQKTFRRENYLNCSFDLNVHKILAFI